MNQTFYQLAAFEFAKVDADRGVIKGVSIITSGVTAKGHNLEVDDTTLSQMKELADEKGQVPVKWNHKTGADAVNGYLTNFRISGKKLKADWHLLKTHAQYEQALELAERMPKNVGLSASFVGKNEVRGGREFARCTELVSVDLVATPAANPDGLFEARVDKPAGGMSKTTNPTGEDKKPAENEVSLAAVLAAVTGLREDNEQRFSALEQRFAVLEEEDDDDEGNDDDEGDDDAASGETGFESFGEVIQYFEQRLAAAEDERERREFEAAVDAVNERFEQITAVNEQLLEENRVMAEALKELQAKTKTVVEFSAGTDGKPAAKITRTDGPKLTEFEARVEELKKGGKDFAEALLTAQDEDQERYRRHLAAKGALAQEMSA